MGSIVKLQDDEHREFQELLPWYVSGQLDAADHARVDAHLATCAECQADVRFEQRLQAEVARLPLEVEEGWAQMKRRLEAEAPAEPIRSAPRASRFNSRWLGWGVAAALTLVVGVNYVGQPQPETGNFHALSAKPVAQPGNVVVIFRPDMTEQAMRELLGASQTRIVDGPTDAGAYVLHAPTATRDTVIATLRENRNVVLAQPIDQPPAP